MKFVRLALVAMLSVAPLAVACGGESGGDDGALDSEDAITGNDIPGVAAIGFASSKTVSGTRQSSPLPTIATEGNVKKLMTALKRTTANANRPLCARPGLPTTDLTFFDKDGKSIATGSYSCSFGSIKFGTKTIYIAPNESKVKEILDGDLTPTDVLFGADKIEVKRVRTSSNGPAKVAFTKADEVADLMDAIKPEFDSNIQARCLPSYTIAWYRGDQQLATAGLLCDAGADVPARTRANFNAPRPGAPEGDNSVNGTLAIDPRGYLAPWNARD